MKTAYFPAHYRLADKLGWLALRAFCVGVLLFLLLPIIVIVPLSFSSGSFLSYPLPGWSLQWYQELFASAEWARAARNSFIVAPLATLLATALGTLAAMGLARTRFVGKGLISGLLISPMVVPIVVVAVSTYLFFARIGLSETYLGLVLVHAALGAPFVVTTVLATLQGFNQNLVKASLSLGAGPVRTFTARDCAGRDLGRAVRLRGLVRRGGGHAVPRRPRAGHAAAPDVHRHPREHLARDRRRGHAADAVHHRADDDPRMAARAAQVILCDTRTLNLALPFSPFRHDRALP